MTKPPCTYPDCTTRAPQYAHLLCKNCYDKLLYRPPGRAGVTQVPATVWLTLAQAGRGKDDCWPWPGFVDSRGYAQVGNGWAHRFAVERAGFVIPEGHDVDHACHNRDAECAGGPSCLHRRCVNFHHLNVVPIRENRSNTALTRRPNCSNGHPKSEFQYRLSTTGDARCRACDQDSWRRFQLARKGA